MIYHFTYPVPYKYNQKLLPNATIEVMAVVNVWSIDIRTRGSVNMNDLTNPEKVIREIWEIVKEKHKRAQEGQAILDRVFTSNYLQRFLSFLKII